MFSRFSIQTRLSTVEAEEVLGRLVRPKIGRLESDPPALNNRPFRGAVERGSFQFRRVINDRNNFLPIISGRIVPGEAGALVHGHVRPALSVAVVMIVWMGVTTIAAIQKLPKAISEHDLLAAIGVAFFPFLGAVLFGLGYSPERHKALRLLTDALRPK